MDELCQAVNSLENDVFIALALTDCVRMGYPIPAVYSRDVTLAECVTLWLEKTGKKQKAVANKAKLLPSKVSEIASGKNPDPQWSTVERLARGFELPLHVFLAGPRPERASGHVQSVADLDPVLAGIIAAAQSIVDAEDSAPDTLEGDVLKAHAVLTRAVQRLGRAHADRHATRGNDS